MWMSREEKRNADRSLIYMTILHVTAASHMHSTPLTARARVSMSDSHMIVLQCPLAVPTFSSLLCCGFESPLRPGSLHSSPSAPAGKGLPLRVALGQLDRLLRELPSPPLEPSPFHVPHPCQSMFDCTFRCQNNVGDGCQCESQAVSLPQPTPGPVFLSSSSLNP